MLGQLLSVLLNYLSKIQILINHLQVKVNECVILSNEVFELMEQLNVLRNQQEQLDEDLSHIKTTAAQRAMDLGRVRIATYNLYLQICRKRARAAKVRKEFHHYVHFALFNSTNRIS